MKIILKVDDFWGKFDDGVFQDFLNFCKQYDIKISLGIVGSGMDNASKDIIDFIRSCKNIQPFNHSYYHLLNPHIISEFYNTSRKYQLASLEKTNESIVDKLGTVNNVVGFVANSFETTTIDIVSVMSSITHIYALKSNDLFDYAVSIGKKILVINEDVVIEKNSIVVNEIDFRKDFEKIKNNNLAVFQLHPGNWSISDMQKFVDIFYFLKNNYCEFILPTEI